MRVLSRTKVRLFGGAAISLPRGEAILVTCVALFIGAAIVLFAIFGSNLSGPAVGRSSIEAPVPTASFAVQSLEKWPTNVTLKEKQ